MLRKTLGTCLAGLVTFLLAEPGWPQEKVFRHYEQVEELNRLGASLCSSSNFAGSGEHRLIIGKPNEEPGGAVKVIDPLAPSIFGNLEISGTVDSVRFGFAVDCIEVQIEGSTRTLIAVGAPDPSLSLTNAEYVAVYDDTGGLVCHIESPVGDGAASLFGYSVAFIDDLDGDSYPDVAVGSPFELHNGSDMGSVRVFSGAPTVGQPELLMSQRGTGMFGMSLDHLGPVDGDDLPELLVDAPAMGAAFVLRITSGPLDARARILHVLPGLDMVGRETPSYSSAVGDFDKDGIPDAAVQHSPNSVKVYSSATGRELGEFTIPVAEEDGGDLVVGGAGDYDADGVPDLGIGLPRSGGCRGVGLDVPACDGDLYVVSGGTGELLSHLPGTEDTQGWAFTALDDFDKNGFPEIASGSPTLLSESFQPESGIGPGAVTVFALKVTPENHLTILGSQKDSDFGRDVSGGFDVDGDGVPDVAVGAPRYNVTPEGDSPLVDAGLVQVFSAATGAEIVRFAGGAAGDMLGFSVELMPDLDGDSVPDLLAGAPGADVDGHTDAGVVYAISGQDGSLLYTVAGAGASSHLGVSLSRAGLVDQDGAEDFIVGAPGCFHLRPVDFCSNPNPGQALVCSGTSIVSGDRVILTLEQAGANEFGRYVKGHSSAVGFLVSAPRDETDQGMGALYAYPPSGTSPHVLRGPSDGFPFVEDGDPQFGVNPIFLDFDGLEPIDIAFSAHERTGVGFETRVSANYMIYDFDGAPLFVPGRFDEPFIYPYAAQAGFGYALLGLQRPGESDRLLLSNPGSGTDFDIVGLMESHDFGAPQISGLSDWDYYGYSVAGAGDVDGDSYEDSVVGAVTDPENLSQGQDGSAVALRTGWNRIMIVLGTPPGGLHLQPRNLSPDGRSRPRKDQ